MRFLFIFLLIFVAAMLGEASPALTHLSWQKCVELLGSNNPEYKAAEWTYKSTQAQELGAESGYYPSLAGSLNYTQSNANGANSGLDTFSLGGSSSSHYTASLNLSQNLFSGLKDSYKFSQARAQTRVAEATFRTAKAKITNAFITAYQSQLTAQESVKLADNIVQRRREDLRLVQLRFESGRENKGSALLSQAYLEQAQYEALQARHSVDLAQTNLAQVLGIPMTDALNISDPVPVEDSTTAPEFERLATETPEHQSILATIDANLAAVGLARSGFLPTLNLTGSMGSTGPDFYPRESDRWSMAASLTIPIFDGGRDYSALQSASFTRNSSLSHRITVDQEAVSNLKQTYQKYLEAVEKLKVDESFQKAALVRAEVARSQYNNGLISFTDWDQIENDLINRQKAYVQSKRDRVLNEAAWNQARGQGVLP